MSGTRLRRSPLPTGVVTFLFTDIQGSTSLVKDLGDAYAEVLSAHHGLLRGAFTRHGGVEVVTTGDGFFVAFSRADDAIAAAGEAQGELTRRIWAGGAEVRVRMGLHTGEARIVDNDYVGLDVHRAARIMSAAHGGQIVMSAATAALLGTSIATKDLGMHRLKGLNEPEHILQPLIEDLPEDFPPLNSLTPPTNIPSNLEAIVGREGEIEALRAILIDSDDRLVTITGIGGVGKTRLASHVALSVVQAFIGGVFFVDLTDVTDAAGVTMAIADAIGAGGKGDVDLAVEIAGRPMLLLLDNFEQATAAAQVVCDVVQGCPNLRALVTSQVLLRVSGEREFPLEPMGLPVDAEVEAVATSDAGRLFVQRAGAARPPFEITQGNARAIAEICRLLDGLPLAIELAAARLKVLSVEELVRRLDDRFKVLTSGARDAPARHQTLYATIEWSYNLLSPEDRAFFRALSVFTGGATLDAISEVAGGEVDALDGVSSLVEHSLLRRSDHAGSSRFSMLQSIARFAGELLDNDPGADPIRARHAEYYLNLATSSEDTNHQLDADLDNFRTSMEWWLAGASTGKPDAGAKALALATGLGGFWYRHGHALEGIEWFDRALVAAGDVEPEVKARALRGLGVLVESTRDLDRAKTLFEEVLELFRAAGSPEGEAAALNSLGIAMRSLGQTDDAESLLEQAVAIRRDLGDEPGISSAMSNLGITSVDRGDLDRAEDLFNEALVIDRRLGDDWGATIDTINLAVVRFERGDLVEAASLSAEALERFSEMGDLDGVAESLEVSAGIAAGGGDHIRAIRLAASAETLRATAGLPSAPPDRARLDRWLEIAHHQLPAVTLEQSREEGASMTTQQATNYALRRLHPESIGDAS